MRRALASVVAVGGSVAVGLWSVGALVAHRGEGKAHVILATGLVWLAVVVWAGWAIRSDGE